MVRQTRLARFQATNVPDHTFCVAIYVDDMLNEIAKFGSMLMGKFVGWA